MAADSPTNFSSGVPGRYASALYARAEETGVLKFAVLWMERLGELIEKSEDFRRLLDSPLIGAKDAAQAGMDVMKAHGFGPLLQNFFGVVATNRRLKQLPAIVKAFAALAAQKRGQITAEVTTAYPLSEVERASLLARLAESGYGSVQLIEKVSPDILGGLIVRIGSRLYDTSLKSRLLRLQHALKGAA